MNTMNELTTTRRTFLKGLVIGGSFLGGVWGNLPWLPDMFRRRGEYVYPDRIENWAGVDLRFSVCRQCRSDCGLEARVFNDTVLKLYGNPYHPNTTEPHLDYDTDPQKAAVVPVAHTLCARGNAGVQSLYDPYRVLLPLKRTGARGLSQFKTISWEQLIKETVNGGFLFKDVPGEETRYVEGFSHLWANGKGRFTPADPKHPDMGPQTNQFVSYWGRAEPGQSDFIERFAHSFGSVNALPHVSICELPHHVSTRLSLDGKSNMIKPDIMNAEYVIWFGAGCYTGNFPMQTFARKIALASAAGMKFVLVDVQATPAVAHAERFVPIKPGGDGALAMGMIRWIIENHRYDADFLANTTLKAANRAGEPDYTNAAYLVIVDSKHPKAFKFARAVDIGLATQSSPNAEKFVVVDGAGRPHIFDEVAQGTLWPHGDLNAQPITVGGVSLQTGFQILYQTAAEFSLAEYAKQAKITEDVIVVLAHDFTSHGKKAAADFYRGPSMHTNGTYNGRAIHTLNFLIGNMDWKGGMIAGGGTADFMGGKPDAPYHLDEWPNQPKGVPNGVTISREGSAYEETSYFKEAVANGKSPFPAQRPWFPFGFGIWPEIFAGTWEAYPYPVKILYQHMGNPAYSLPGMGGHPDETLPWFRLIKDMKKVPLFITDDITVCETSAYADYIVPDCTYLEAWGALPGFPTYPFATIGVRQPVVEPLTGRTPDARVMCFETYMIDVAEKLGMPGFGDNAFMEGGRLHQREDYYLKMVANIAYDSGSYFSVDSSGELVKEGPVPDGSPTDEQSVSRWNKMAPNAMTSAQWRKAAYVMARGGRFEDYDVAYRGPQRDWLTHRYGNETNLLQIYNETAATTHNALTGERFHGTAAARPQRTMKGRLLDQIDSAAEYKYHLVTYKLPIHTHSRTMADPWLRELMPESFIDINDFDAQSLGLRGGDVVRVSSASHPKEMTGRVRILPGVRMGVIAFTHSFGHWQYGSGTWKIDGKTMHGDDSRNAGVRLNPLIGLDPDMLDSTGWGTCLEDPVSGGSVYYDTKVKVEKVTAVRLKYE